MKFPVVLAVTLLFTLGIVAGCGSLNNSVSEKKGSAQVQELTISAAASLTDGLAQIEKDYKAVKPGIKLIFNYGASGTLQQQIEQGAPVDLFISAGKAQMDALETKKLIVSETRADLLGNELVLIVGKNNTSITSVQDLIRPQVSKVSIGTPEIAPAGKYSQEALTALNLWNPLQTKLVPAKDVRQVLTYVETGNVDAGLVYLSDSKGSDKVKVAAVIPGNSHKPIVYPAAVLSDSKNKEAAEDFLHYLEGPQAQQVFAEYGFRAMNKQ